MSVRPDRDADLEAAYAQARGLADDGRGPSASVRANVLAAALEVAAQAQSRGAAGADAVPPLSPVAPPVAAVGRGRAMAVNLSSWRVRSGAAICAALLVALGVSRFEASRRVDGGEQVATASLELASPPTAALPRELPRPPLSAASIPYAPPPVVDDPADLAPHAKAAAAAPRDRRDDLVIAQLDHANRSLPVPPQADARAEARRPAPAAALPAPPAPLAMAPEARTARAPAPEQPPARVTITAAAAPPQIATLPPMLPSVVPRRVALAPLAKATAEGTASVAAAEPAPQRLEITGSSLKRVDAADAAAVPTLQTAADRGDVETLKTLLAAPAAHVDAPDAAGRTALLHAVLAQQAGAVRLLVAAGADPARADPAGLTPRAAAQAGASAEIAALLAAPR